MVQLDSAITDLKGLTIFVQWWRILSTANIGNQEKLTYGTVSDFQLFLDPSWRDSTVLFFESIISILH